MKRDPDSKLKAEDVAKPIPEEPGRLRVPGFDWGKAGLFKVSMVAARDETGAPTGETRQVRTWLAPPFEVAGLMRDRRGRGWCLLLAWKDRDGCSHEEPIPGEALGGEGTDLCRTLAHGGLLVTPETKERKHLVGYLNQAFHKTTAVARSVSSVGWHGQAYLLRSGEVFGPTPERLIYTGAFTATGDDPETAGSLDAWRELVAAPLHGNPFMAFAVCCAFAGPLLKHSGAGGGGFHYRAFSSKGKSTALECAASVWGCPDPLPTWRATSNGLEGVAHAHDAGFLPLDELSQVDPREAGQCAYMLSNGAGKARANKDGDARAMKRWELVFLSTGEVSLADRVAEEGRRIRAGQEVRLVDIPCPTEGLIATVHGHSGPGALADHVRAGARANYGHPIRAFLEQLTSSVDTLPQAMRDMQGRWREKAVPAGADGQVRRVASRFALVASAGELAQRFGILPWPAGFASEAAEEAFRAWLNTRGGIGASEVFRGIQGVLDFLQRHGMSRFDVWGDATRNVINRAGTRKLVNPESEELIGWDYYLTPEGWREACTGFDPKALAKIMCERGLLEMEEDGRTARKVRIPHHGQARMYLIPAVAISKYLSPEDAA